MKQDLERIEIPEEHEARERTWRVVESAFAEREPQPRRRSWKPIAAVALAVAVVAGLLSPPGRAVLDEIRDVVGVEKAEPALFSLPTSGQLLITSNTGTWVVDPDGSKRFLGDFRQAAWSPFGRFIVGARQNELVAMEPNGDVRWTLARPDTRLPRWGGTRTDTRIAYLSGFELRVVGGDGKGDRMLDRPAMSAPSAWQPGPGHRLAYRRRDGTVRVVDVDTGRVLDRDAAPGLLVPRPQDTALLRRLLGDRVVLGVPVRSPDGRWLTVHWPAADQLLFVRTFGRPQLRAVSNVSSQFGTRRSLAIEGWCCAP